MRNLPSDFGDMCKLYLDQKNVQSSHEKLARQAKNAVDLAKSTLLRALKGSVSGKCLNYILTVVHGKTDPATLTARSGRVFMLSDIDNIKLTDGTVIQGKDITALKGEKNFQDKLEITTT